MFRGRLRLLTLSAVALLTGTAYVYGGFLPGHPWPVALLAVVGFFAALIGGIRRSHSARPFLRLSSGTLYAGGFLLLLALPAAYRVVTLYAEARTIPIPPGSKLLRVSVDPVRFNDVPDFLVVCQAEADTEEMMNLYTSELGKQGWRGDPQRAVHVPRLGASLRSPNKNETLSLDVSGLFFRDEDRRGVITASAARADPGRPGSYLVVASRTVVFRPDDPQDGPRLPW